jgi:hypothetical protein
VQAMQARQEAHTRAREAAADERARHREAAANLGAERIKAAAAPKGTPRPVSQGSGELVP